ncbi:Zinc import ATP-binding protein ZnuC [Corynebacterium choanae]|uniref:Zinc import ATP-binding protein ZnuC n=2 Tax=Corynebacterium choanae TaxID=1862358 RepID=A0A3G6J5H9_9CORY|nr:Zinc import ATP-binding protein ZnuC [Corynebacterium choanae]
MAVESALEIEDLTVHFGSRTVLDQVSVAFPAGQFIAIVGPNGAGKTTLLRAILNMVDYRGEIRVDGIASAHRRNVIGYVPQRHNIDWEFPLNVSTMVATGLVRGRRPWHRTTAEQWRQVGAALDQVGMKALHDRPIAALSGGQRQRVLLARALVKQPRVLLLDEPNTGLDMPGEAAMLQTCRNLVKEGTTVIMTTHELGSAMDGCDWMLILKQSVQAFGRPADLKDPQVWMQAFAVPEDHHLLRTVGAVPTASVMQQQPPDYNPPTASVSGHAASIAAGHQGGQHPGQPSHQTAGCPGYGTPDQDRNAHSASAGRAGSGGFAGKEGTW